jgi:hypothetical protein
VDHEGETLGSLVLVPGTPGDRMREITRT